MRPRSRRARRLRAPDGLKAPVTIDEILEALCALDGDPRHPPGGKPMRLRSAERRAAPDWRQIAMDKAMSYLNGPSDQAIVRALQAQVQAWSSEARPKKRDRHGRAGGPSSAGATLAQIGLEIMP